MVVDGGLTAFESATASATSAPREKRNGQATRGDPCCRIVVSRHSRSSWRRAAGGRQTEIGFVTHAQGNPFIQQIRRWRAGGRQRTSASSCGGRRKPAATRKRSCRAVQNFVNSGVQGVATSVPGESMAKGLNELIGSGVPIVQYNLLGASVHAPYVGEKSVESGRILGRMIVEKLGGAGAPAPWSSATASPAFRCWRTAPRASRNC